MRRLASATAAALLTAAAIVTACADSSEEPTPPAPGDDASLTPTADAAQAPDAAIDAGDAGPTADRICSDDDWCHTEPPPDHHFLDVWGDGAGMLWAASIIDPGGNDEHGGIARWDGKTWSQHHVEPKTKVSAIWGSGPSDLWAGGPGGLLHGDGTTWTPVDLGEKGIQVDDITGSATSGIWVVGTSPLAEESAARAFHRAPGSTVWTRVSIEAPDAGPDALTYSEIRSAWVVSNGDTWICARSGRDYLLRLRAAAGSKWTVVPTPTEPFQYTGVGPVADDPWILGYVLFKGGAKYWNAKASVVADAGDWTAARWKGNDPSSDQIRRFAIWGLAADDVWSGGAFALLQHWDGTTWTTTRTSVDDIPIADDVVAFWGKANDDLWAVGGRSALHKVSKVEAARLEAEHAALAEKDGAP